jgi:hypothetical protein
LYGLERRKAERFFLVSSFEIEVWSGAMLVRWVSYFVGRWGYICIIGFVCVCVCVYIYIYIYILQSLK